MDLLKEEYSKKFEAFDNHVDYCYRKGRHIIPVLARLLLVSTFLDDSFRMVYDYSTQISYFKYQWNSKFWGFVFIIFNLITQFIGSVGLIVRKKITESCALLVFNLIIQFFVYVVYLDMHLFMRFLSLIGGLTLSVSEWRASIEKEKTKFTGMLSNVKVNRTSSFMNLFGRIVCTFMYLTLIQLNGTITNLLLILFGIILLPCIIIGYRTKAASLILSVWLTLYNFITNHFWSITSDSFIDDYAKYDFFQTLSVIGGLLYITTIGAGSISIDEYKKQF
ncbi:Surfeit locus protein 4 [Intoshia linei]|uniref:Surfeit locus protein 4 n=1 Tax=Intoshia linei TaxID=1819745 RepID=A0A177B6B1_9BILA|nr:Surfeit locus protein 4 [Intoshia linei]